jgi:hypothetical protein
MSIGVHCSHPFVYRLLPPYKLSSRPQKVFGIDVNGFGIDMNGYEKVSELHLPSGDDEKI